MMFKIIYLVIFSIVGAVLATEAAASEASECRKQIQPAVQEIREKVKALQKSEPDLGKGGQVDVGSCASRLRKLAGNFLCCRTFANIAPVWEEISCLELKKHYLEKSCSCIGSGGFSSDEALQNGVYEQYSAIKELRKKALAKGIPNPAIRAYVKGASAAMDCINMKSISILDSIDKKLTDALAK